MRLIVVRMLGAWYLLNSLAYVRVDEYISTTCVFTSVRRSKQTGDENDG